MEDRGEAQVAQGGVVEPEPDADLLRLLDDRAGVLGRVGVLGLERGDERLRGAEVGALELLVERGRAQRGADLVGDRLDEPHVVLAERAGLELLDVDDAPQLLADPQRHDSSERTSTVSAVGW